MDQIDAVRSTLAALSGPSGVDRGRVVMPCGTGKTLVGLWVAEGLQMPPDDARAGVRSVRSVVVFVPTLLLVRQTLNAWRLRTRLAAEEWSWLAVCSDDSIAEDEPKDAKVTTDPSTVRVRWVKERVRVYKRGH